jgi:hypothetical protein
MPDPYKPMQNILLQPQTQDEARLVRQFAKLMKIKAVAVKETPKERKKREILADLEQSVEDANDYFAGRKHFKTAAEVLNEL